MTPDLTLLVIIGLAFVLARLFEMQTERDRKTDERTRGNYCNWNDDGRDRE